jgi:phage-related protein
MTSGCLWETTAQDLWGQLANVSDLGHNGRVKPVDFHPRALDFIREQPASVRQQIGEALRDLQKGVRLGMPLSRPMTDVARGVHELRIKAERSTIRVFYCLGRSEAIIVVHAFQKKSHKTPVREINLARQRLQEVLDEAIES